MRLTFDMVKKDERVRTFIEKADASLLALGYTEHSFTHVMRTAECAARILRETGHSEREAELAAIAGYLHDIGNVINRDDHEQSGAIMAYMYLTGLGADAGETATIISAIGNHDEGTAFPVNDVAAALILADKTDVRYTRVRNKDTVTFDIHDRVNYAVKKSEVLLDSKAMRIDLHLTVDSEVSSISDYFEIFLGRMRLCRRAAERLKLMFGFYINGQSMM
ncbi:MAG: HD domain-containing protein [Clostridiales bacterium]|jgi:metal-dependent HD superfamily phosphatase/phosphodiesterase|nr:HD domain-containing protein [Clostridiales bacterium]